MTIFFFFFWSQENAIAERPQPRTAVRTMRTHHENSRYDHVSDTFALSLSGADKTGARIGKITVGGRS